MRFDSITSDNQHWVDRIFAGEQEQYWVHYNRYWLDQAQAHPDIAARLVYAGGHDTPVGFVAYGQHYADEALSEPVAGWYEVIHLVIDKPQQGRGYGRQATELALDVLRRQPGCSRIVIAHHPDNLVARRLYESLGFRAVGSNYDGDPLLGTDV